MTCNVFWFISSICLLAVCLKVFNSSIFVFSVSTSDPIVATVCGRYVQYIYIYINKNSYSIFHMFLLFTQLSSVEIYYRIKTIYTHTATWRYNIPMTFTTFNSRKKVNAVPSLYSVLAVHVLSFLIHNDSFTSLWILSPCTWSIPKTLKYMH